MTKSNELTTQYEMEEKKGEEETADRHIIHILHNQQPSHN